MQEVRRGERTLPSGLPPPCSGCPRVFSLQVGHLTKDCRNFLAKYYEDEKRLQQQMAGTLPQDDGLLPGAGGHHESDLSDLDSSSSDRWGDPSVFGPSVCLCLLLQDVLCCPSMLLQRVRLLSGPWQP